MPTNNVQLLLAQDIPDPTDFSASNLRDLDASFRCTICGEFFDAPISLACGHCFCSLCIREHLVREPECPSCRKSASEAQFRVNPALEEVVSAWKAARSTVLELSREERPSAASARSSTNDRTPRRLRTPARNGRKRRHSAVSPSSGPDVVCVAGPSKPNPSSEIGDSSPLGAKSTRRASRRTNREPSSDPREEELSALQPSSLVECPVCGDSVEFQVINDHMDGSECGRKPSPEASNPNAKTQWSKILGSRPGKAKLGIIGDVMERLPKVSYDVLKDKALKELLSSQQLPVSGDRHTRIARHRRWVMMYNANLDKSMGRRTLPELRLELRTWEEGQRGPKHVVEDVSAHAALHREEFSRLAEEARQSKYRPPILDGAREGTVTDGQEHL